MKASLWLQKSLKGKETLRTISILFLFFSLLRLLKQRVRRVGLGSSLLRHQLLGSMTSKVKQTQYGAMSSGNESVENVLIIMEGHTRSFKPI